MQVEVSQRPAQIQSLMGERMQSVQNENILRDLHRQSALAPHFPSFITQLPH